MDCMRALEIVTGTIGQPEESQTPEFVAARHHCVTCASCRAFYQASLRLHETRGPAAPPALSERVMGAVVVEAHAAAARRRAASEAVPSAALTPPEPAAIPVSDGETDRHAGPGAPDDPMPFPLASPKPRREMTASRWLAWGAGAAAVLIVAVLIGKAGLTMIVAPGGSTGTRALPESAPAYTDPESNQATIESPAGSSAADAVMAASDRPAYVTLGTRVYEEVGTEPTKPSGAKAAGYVRTARATAEEPQNLSASFGSDELVLYVEATDVVIEYRAVVRTLSGKAYALSSPMVLERYGVWPQLPVTFPAPGADGSPTFVAGPKDDSGQQTYVLPGPGGADSGFALPPGQGDNPNWTWWEPID